MPQTETGLVLEIRATPVPRSTKRDITVRLDCRIIHADRVELRDSKQRTRLRDEIVRRVNEEVPGVADLDWIEQELLQRLAEQPHHDGRDTESNGRRATYRIESEADDLDQRGMYAETENGGSHQLTDAIITITRDTVRRDERGETRTLEVAITLGGQEYLASIDAGDYADDKKLKAFLYRTVGPRIRIHAGMDRIRDAVAELSEPAVEIRMTALGWDEDRQAYRVPGGMIDAEGVRPYAEGEARVELDTESPARRLDLKLLPPERLDELKRHVADDLLHLHHRPVSFTAVAAVALAILLTYVRSMSRPIVWFKGLTGEGKSFLAELVQCFFGAFGRFGDAANIASWASTANYLQWLGYHFRDAVFVVDDYKPDVARPHEVIRLLQNYADGAARGRLRADASAREVLPIRGLLLATGEDVPDHSASALARMAIIDVPRHPKDLEKGRRCLENRPDYPGLTADFIRYVIAGRRGEHFAARVEQLRDAYLEAIRGQPNDLRIAGNYALLGAAFEEMAEYLEDSWADREAETRAFVEEDLPAMCLATVGAAREQQASELFLQVLSELIRNRRVRIANSAWDDTDSRAPQIGMLARRPALDEPDRDPGVVYEVGTMVSIQEVNKVLRDHGRPPLAATARTLIAQLAEAGALVDDRAEDDAGRARTTQRRFEGKVQRCLRLHAAALGLEGGGRGKGAPLELIP